jgi:23S rRNA pseudouridine2605 synthase
VPRHGVARVLSKLGMASRTQASGWVLKGRVRVNGRVVIDPEFPVRRGVDRISVDGRDANPSQRLVIMLNKPRGLVTTTRDERNRETVYRCFEAADLPWLAPVGRLDKASEGLLLFSNDPAWAAKITDPSCGPQKRYHVQINRHPDAAFLAALLRGVTSDGEHLSATAAAPLRIGEKNAWLDVTLDEGRNRQIRRLLAALDTSVLRLIRLAIGPLLLGDLPKGHWRVLTEPEIANLERSPIESSRRTRQT